MNRRDFLHASLATPAALAGLNALAAEKDELPVLDAHVHLWDLKEFKLPWMKPDAPFAKNFLVADYLDATKGCHVTEAIYMEVDVAPEQKQKEADWIRSVIKEGKSPLIAAVVGCVVRDEGFPKYARQFKGDPHVRGLRQVIHNPETPSGYCLNDDFVKHMKLLGELGLTFDLCLRHGDLKDGIALAGKCPGTQFVLDHCGNPDLQAKEHSAWKKDIETFAKKQNVACKISGILATAKKGEWTPEQLAPVVNHCLDSFGPDRVIYAGDWPVCLLGGTLKQWLDAVKEITKTHKDEERRKLFSGNAHRVYGVKKA
jgi:L-fuconolactonase